MVHALVTRAKLRRLADELGGQSEVARLLRVNRSCVSRWLSGGEPDAIHKARLDALDYVLSRLLQRFPAATAHKWLSGINAPLGNRRPLDLIVHNRVAEVIAAIEQDELNSHA